MGRTGTASMVDKDFNDCAPDAAHLTSYDEAHLTDYLRLLDAANAGASWRQIARDILDVDPSHDPVRAKTMYDSHLARAHWMTEVGYAHLLGQHRHPD